MKTNGPRIRLDVSCSDCEHHTTERYTCQGDSGREHYCNQPGVKMDNARGKFGARYIGETSQTPINLVPLLPVQYCSRSRAQEQGALMTINAEGNR